MYTEEQSVGSVVPAGTAVLAAEDFSAAAAVHGEHIVLKKVQIKRVMFVVSLAIVSTGAVQVTFTRRPTPGSLTGAVLLGTLVIPAGTAIGKVLYKDISPAKLFPGDALALEATVASAGGGAAGMGYYGFDLDLQPEVVANSSDMVASA